MRHITRHVLMIALCVFGLGVAQADTGTLPGSPLVTSGFLGSYSDLRKVPGEMDTWQWVKPGVDWKSYDKIMVQPIEVWINPQSAYPGIQPDVYKQMADHFRQKLVVAFRDGGYQVVDKPGAGVLRLHIALTGMTPERPGLTPLDVLPFKMAINVARRAAHADKTVVAVAAEIEALDGATGQRVFAQVTTKKDAQHFVGKDLSWEELGAAATEWAQQARARLDAARQRRQ